MFEGASEVGERSSGDLLPLWAELFRFLLKSIEVGRVAAVAKGFGFVNLGFPPPVTPVLEFLSLVVAASLGVIVLGDVFSLVVAVVVVVELKTGTGLRNDVRDRDDPVGELLREPGTCERGSRVESEEGGGGGVLGH